MAENLEASSHMSALRHISKCTTDMHVATQPLSCIRSSLTSPKLPLTVADYLGVIDWSSRLTRADKRGVIEAAEPPILRKFGLTEG